MNNRISKLLTLMAKRRLDAILVSSVPNITYLTNFSHFSKDEREAVLFITMDKQYILTDGRYSEAVKNKVRDFELVETSPKLSFEKALKALAKKHEIKKVGVEEDNLTAKEHKMLTKRFNDIYHFSINSQRTIKDRREIAAIEKACELGDKTFKYTLNKIKLGISEKQLAFEIEFFIKKQGADISFPAIVAFGKNSSNPHHAPTNNKLTNNQIVLLDFGARLNNYCSDMTRTVFFGKPSSKQKRIYQTVLDAQKRAIDYLNRCHSELVSESKPKTRSRNKFGMTGKDVDKIAQDYITSKGYPTIPHSLGHGIGLEVHESPRLYPKSKDILKSGVVFTIEPGIYIPGFGGVRIEDVVLLEESYPRLLTTSSRGLTIL